VFTRGSGALGAVQRSGRYIGVQWVELEMYKILDKLPPIHTTSD